MYITRIITVTVGKKIALEISTDLYVFYPPEYETVAFGMPSVRKVHLLYELGIHYASFSQPC
jgi:hypothetical protein